MSAEGARHESDRTQAEQHAPLSAGLLSFYDRLRRRVTASLEGRAGRRGAAAAEALLLVPDVFFLLARLALDREVPKPTRALVASALAYFVLPVDLFPELTLGVAGYADDLVLAAAVLSQAFGRDLEPYAARYWSGTERLRRVLGDASQAAAALLGDSVYGRLKRLLARRGIDLDTPPTATDRPPSTPPDDELAGPSPV